MYARERSWYFSRMLFANVSTILGPILVAFSMWAYAYDCSIEGVRGVQEFLYAVPALAAVASIVAHRRESWLLPARFLVLLTAFFAIYCAGAQTGVYSSSSLTSRPSLLIALVVSAWTFVSFDSLKRPTAAAGASASAG